MKSFPIVLSALLVVFVSFPAFAEKDVPPPPQVSGYVQPEYATQVNTTIIKQYSFNTKALKKGILSEVDDKIATVKSELEGKINDTNSAHNSVKREHEKQLGNLSGRVGALEKIKPFYDRIGVGLPIFIGALLQLLFWIVLPVVALFFLFRWLSRRFPAQAMTPGAQAPGAGTASVNVTVASPPQTFTIMVTPVPPTTT